MKNRFQMFLRITISLLLSAAVSPCFAASASGVTERFMTCEMKPGDKPKLIPATYTVFGAKASAIKLMGDGQYATAEYVLDQPLSVVSRAMGITDRPVTAAGQTTIDAWRRDHGVTLTLLAGNRTKVFCGTDQGQY